MNYERELSVRTFPFLVFLYWIEYFDYLCNVLQDKLLEIIRKCLILVEIAKLSKKYIQGTDDSSYGGLLVLCIYMGIWRYLTSIHGRQPTSFYNITLFDFSLLAATEFTRKNRHYEKIVFYFIVYLLYKRIFILSKVTFKASNFN